jgi:hypothetical protein
VPRQEDRQAGKVIFNGFSVKHELRQLKENSAQLGGLVSAILGRIVMVGHFRSVSCLNI